MKKVVISAVLVLIIAFSSACVYKTDPSNALKDNTTVETKDPDTASQAERTATVDGNYKIERLSAGGEYAPDAHIYVRADARNISGETWDTADLNAFFTATLYTVTDGGKYVSAQVTHAATEPYTCKNGEIWSRTFLFYVDSDAPAGDYDLEISLNGAVTVFENVVTVTAKNENR